MLLLWWVAHTRPRCEKKLVEFCQLNGISATLPCYKSVKKYRGKTVTFTKPLFPNYVFLQLKENQWQLIRGNKHVANLLQVVDQDTLERQLEAVLQALDSEYEVTLAPEIKPGMRVKIKSGSLRGLEGDVQERHGMVKVSLRLDFISQGAAVTIDASELELI